MSVLNYTRKKNTRSPKGVEMFAFVFIKFFYLYWYIYIIIILNRKVLLDYCSVVYGSASKSTPIPAQQVLAGAIPLDIRWKQLMTNYWTNLKGHNEQHLTKVVVQECTEVLSTVIPEAEPWTRSTTLADMNLLELKKSEWGKVSLLTAFFSSCKRALYSQYVQIHTDGSRTSDNCGCFFSSRKKSYWNNAYSKLSGSLVSGDAGSTLGSAFDSGD